MFWLPGVIVGVAGYLAARRKPQQTDARGGDAGRSTPARAKAAEGASEKPPAAGGGLIAARDTHALALGNLGLATVGALSTPHLLLAASVAVVLVQGRSVFGSAYRAIADEKKVDSAVLATAFVGVGVFSRAFWATSFASWFYHLCTYLRVKTEDHSSRQLVEVFTSLPREVWLLRDGAEVAVPLSSVERGDVIAVHAGSVIPVDGVVVSGAAQVDEHVLTGEALIAEKGEGSSAAASTMVLAGKILVRTEETGKDTIASQVARTLASTGSYIASVELRGQTIADRAAAPTLIAGTASLMTLGSQVALSVVTADFGLGMMLLEPLAILSHLDMAARKGIVVRDGRSLQGLWEIDTIIFDKTGTLTHSRPKVELIHSWDGRADREILRLAASMEARQSHPIARSILEHAAERGIQFAGLDRTAIEIGYGLRSSSAGCTLRIGSARFMEMEGIDLTASSRIVRDRCHGQGNSLVLVAVDEELVGGIELSPRVRAEARGLVRQFRDYCEAMYIVSGDHEAPTRRLAEELGIDEYRANVGPQDKARLIEELQQEGKKVLFIGDGINDAIALKTANVSISFLGASNLATDSSQIILPDGNLEAVRELFRISREFERSMSNNLTLLLGSTGVVLTGVFLMGMPFVGALLITDVATAVGILNAHVLPRRRRPTRE